MFRNSYQKIQEQIKNANKQDNINLSAIEKSDEVDPVQYVYHRKMPEFVGNWVIPLNKMPSLPNFESTYKQVYEKAKTKYIGREETMEMTWPAFGNCKWNDVNFLSPIHPNYIYQEFQKIGISTEDENFTHFFKIPVSQLNHNPAKTLIWTFPSASDDPSVTFPLDSFCQVDANTYKELDGLPEKTKEYYKEKFYTTSKKPLVFMYVPHVLTTEPIEITKDTSVIHWKNPRF